MSDLIDDGLLTPLNGVPSERIMRIASGRWIGIPLDMNSCVKQQITLTQASYTQDFSLRFWISIYPLGAPLYAPQPVLKTAVLPIVVFVEGTNVAPEDGIPISLPAGMYVLNVYNLTNEMNLLELTVHS